MRIKRELADYDPFERFYKSAVVNDIIEAESVIAAFDTSPFSDRRAFAAWVLFRKR